MSLFWTILILLAVNAATIAAMLLVRSRAPEGSYFKDGDRASGGFGVLAGGFAIFAGFIIFLAFTTYDQSRSGGEAEALTVVQQFETAELLPPAVRDSMTGAIVCYGRSVVHQEWPQMQEGKGGDTINPWSIALFRSLQLVNPKSASEQAAYSKWLDQTSDREAGRRDRLHGAEGIIPASIWLVLFLIAGVVFTFMLFFADSGEGVPSQAMLMGSATTVIVLTLAAINALNHPYAAGVGQIKPVAMQRSLRILDTARTVLNVRAPVPCDARGARVSSCPKAGGSPVSTATSSSWRPCCSRWPRWRPHGRPTSRRAGTASRPGRRAHRSPPASSRRAPRTWRTGRGRSTSRCSRNGSTHTRATRPSSPPSTTSAFGPSSSRRSKPGWRPNRGRTPAPRCRRSPCRSTSSPPTRRPTSSR